MAEPTEPYEPPQAIRLNDTGRASGRGKCDAGLSIQRWTEGCFRGNNVDVGHCVAGFSPGASCSTGTMDT